MQNVPIYKSRRHAAARTGDFVYNQLIPYIGSKRKLLGLISQALGQGRDDAKGKTFLDMFAGSGVVARYAKTLGYKVISNDWEPYSRAINGCYIACNGAPKFEKLGGYRRAISLLNELAPREDWVTKHLCPQDDDDCDSATERMFYMRKNGQRIDAIRHQISEWHGAGAINDAELDCLLAPLVYQACYRSNTSGVFKGFHNGWGGRTRTALYRIATDLLLAPAVFFNNGQKNEVFSRDAQQVAEDLSVEEIDIAYLDPPYNQHPYGSNYHVLNSIVLWDKPEVPEQITRGTKSAIRLDWRTERRSAYNHSADAADAYRLLLETLNARYILTSYSTDGMIPLDEMLEINASRGRVAVEMQGYKRYRVSSQRFSQKPMNVEFVIVLDTHKKNVISIDELNNRVKLEEEHILSRHPELQPV